MRETDRYKYEFSNAVKAVIESSELSIGEKCVFIGFLVGQEFDEYDKKRKRYLDRFERFDETNQVFIVCRRLDEKDLAKRIGMTVKSVHKHIATLIAGSYIKKVDMLDCDYGVSILDAKLYNAGPTDRHLKYEVYDTANLDKIMKPSFPYRLEHAFPEVFFLLPTTKMNLVRKLSDLYRTTGKSIFVVNDAHKITLQLLESQRSSNTINKIKNDVDVLIVACFPDDKKAAHVLLDCLYARRRNNLCSVIILPSGAGKTNDILYATYRMDEYINERVTTLYNEGLHFKYPIQS